MTFENIITGRAFGVKEWVSKNGKAYTTFSFSYGKKDLNDNWNNVYINITLFADYVPGDKEMLKLKGKFEPKVYTKKDGMVVEGIAFIAFEVIESEYNNSKNKAIDFSNMSDDDLETFDDDMDVYVKTTVNKSSIDDGLPF